MTEAEWLSSDDPGPLHEFLRGRASDRKMRLFAVACCRHLGSLVTTERYLQTVETSERYADGVGKKADLKRARHSVGWFRTWRNRGKPGAESEWVALWLAEVTASENVHRRIGLELKKFGDLGLIGSGNRPPECDLLRCIFGNPFRNITIDPAWLNESVVSLARAIYDDRGFDDLPILGDALEEAGCDHPDIRYHCRAHKIHGRGCWVVDALLDKR